MTLRDTKRRVAILLPHLFFAAIFAYFAYHIVHGERGVLRGRIGGARDLSPYSRAPWLVPVVSGLLALVGIAGSWRAARSRG